MIAPDRNDALQFPSRIVILFGAFLGALAQVRLKLSLELDIGVLRGTGAHCEQ